MAWEDLSPHVTFLVLLAAPLLVLLLSQEWLSLVGLLGIVMLGFLVSGRVGEVVFEVVQGEEARREGLFSLQVVAGGVGAVVFGIGAFVWRARLARQQTLGSRLWESRRR